MATLSADKPRSFEQGDYADYPVVASDIIYQGSALGWSSGEVRPLVAGDKFAGFSLAQCDNSAGSAGDKLVKVMRRGYILLPITGDADGDEGQAVYASDDDTFTLVGKASNTRIGILVRYDSTTTLGLVQFDVTDLEVQASCGQGVPVSASFVIGAEGTNAITVTGQLIDANGEDLDRAAAVHAYLSSDSAGQAIEAAAATTVITHGEGAGDGSVHTFGAANSAGHQSMCIVSEADGDFAITITETAGANTFYLNLVMPSGKIVTSAAITFAA